MQGCGWPAGRIGERVGDGAAFGRISTPAGTRGASRGAAKKKANPRSGVADLLKRSLQGSLPATIDRVD